MTYAKVPSSHVYGSPILRWHGMTKGIYASMSTSQYWDAPQDPHSTHCGRDKITAIPQTFSDSFSWMKMYDFRLRFHWTWFLRFEFAIFLHWFKLWLGADQATKRYLKQLWFVYYRIYASLGLNDLKWKYHPVSVENLIVQIKHFYHVFLSNGDYSTDNMF